FQGFRPHRPPPTNAGRAGREPDLLARSRDRDSPIEDLSPRRSQVRLGKYGAFNRLEGRPLTARLEARIECGARLLCWSDAEPRWIRDGDVRQLFTRLGALQQHPSPRHVAMTDEFFWENQSGAEDRFEHIDVLSRGDAPQ